MRKIYDLAFKEKAVELTSSVPIMSSVTVDRLMVVSHQLSSLLIVCKAEQMLITSTNNY